MPLTNRPESDLVIAIIGLGYVGLPLAIEFGKYFEVIGFDISNIRIAELRNGFDLTLEIDVEALKQQHLDRNGILFTSEESLIEKCSIKIVTVPTPVDEHNNPDLSFLINATEMIGKLLQKGDIVIYESTVYPGCTEEICVPILERYSQLKYNTDFFCGYSPERINPGDPEHTLSTISKVVSGSTPDIAKKIEGLYQKIIKAGIYVAPSIKIAEAAKVIENAQRDINIAFVNELAKIFCLLGIDTHEVLQAASTKWNFLNFKPGLVGGHCIGVDPYYLARKATSVGYYPEIILSGRRINDSMGPYIAGNVIRLMIEKLINVFNSQVLVLGITFKENCPDVRNTKVIGLIKEMNRYKAEVTVYDPWINAKEVALLYHINCLERLPNEKKYDAVIVAVAHNDFINVNYQTLLKPVGVLYDVKGVLDPQMVDGRL